MSHKVSLEMLYHYRCGECEFHWSLSDKELPVITCPNCGHKDTVEDDDMFNIYDWELKEK